MIARALTAALCLLLAACTADAPPIAAAQLADSATPATSQALAARAPLGDAELLARGEYLVRIAGCNDCHTEGYAQAGGEVPREQWLLGSREGFSGPWGTTYPANLRLRLQGLDEDEWMAYSATLRTRPLMPDFALRAMHDDDRRALYRFIRSLEPVGQPAPAWLPPGQVPQAPYLALVLPEAPATD